LSLTATVPVMLDPHPVLFEMDDQALQAEFGQFADEFNLDDPDREALSREFGRLTSVFGNPDRIHAVCQDIVDHHLAGAYRNGLKAQVVAFNRELAVACTDKLSELLASFETSQVLAEVGKHERITAEVNISVSDSKDENAAMLPFRLSEAEEEEQKRRFLTPDGSLCFLVVTAKLMTRFDAPNEGVLYLDKPLKAHTLFQTVTRPNRTWESPGGFVKASGVIVDYIGLAEEVQRAVTDPTGKGSGKGGGFVVDLSDLVAEFRTTFARIEDLLVDVDGLDLTVHGYESVRAINDFLDASPAAAETFAGDYWLLARLYPLINTDQRVAKVPGRLRAVRIGVHNLVQEVLRRGAEATTGRAGADGPGDHQCSRPLLLGSCLPGGVPRLGRAGHRDPQRTAGPRTPQVRKGRRYTPGTAIHGADPGRYEGRSR
jgi:type I restriction enzyme, R subunit